MRKLALFLAALFFAAPAFAEAPAVVARYVHASKPCGQASLTRLWMRAYEATLWTNASSWSMDEPFALALRYGMSFSTQEIVDRTKEEMKRVSNLSDAQISHYGALLSGIFPNVSKGDTITAVHTGEGATLFFYNGKPIGRVMDKNFAGPFFGIWLSPKTSEPEMRTAMLGCTHD